MTVTAEQTLLQTDTALRKTIESKDIEQLSFSGRNPIGVAGLKAGVVGGSFNNYGFSDLGNGGFSINGSRTDENNITVDGATAIRTRSQRRDRRHPERRRDPGSPGADGRLHARVRPRQRRTDPHGHQERRQPLQRQRLVSSMRDDKLQANTWTRNQSPNALENSGPAPFDYKQYRVLARRADPDQR